MLEHVSNENNKHMSLRAENQCWDEAALKQLKDEYNIIFMTKGCANIPVMIINKHDDHPSIVFGTEKDGIITFKKHGDKFENCFCITSIKPLIADLNAALDFCFNTFAENILNEIKEEERVAEENRKKIIKEGCLCTEKEERTGLFSGVHYLRCKVCGKRFDMNGNELKD